MTPECKQTIEELINHFDYDCTTDEFKYYPSLNWGSISAYEYLSEGFIREFIDEMEWHWISIYQGLSENFIREFRDKVHWPWISECQKLSEEFIREFQYKVEWLYISASQELSEDFIREFKNKVNWEHIIKHNKKINLDNFYDVFFLDFASEIKKFGTPEQMQRLDKIQNRTVNRAYDIIL